MSRYYSPSCCLLKLTFERFLNASGRVEQLNPTEGQWDDDDDVNP